MGFDLAEGHRDDALVQLHVDRGEHGFRSALAVGEQLEDLLFTLQAVVDQFLELAGDVVDGLAVAGEEDGRIVGLQAFEGLQIEGHVAVGRRGDGHGAEAESGVAGKEGAFVAQVVADGAERVPGRVDDFDRQATHANRVAAADALVQRRLCGLLAELLPALADFFLVFG